MNADCPHRRILLVDDDPEFIEKAMAILPGFAEVRIAGDVDEALELNTDWRPHLIMLDALIGTGDSFALLDALREARPAERFGIVCLAKGRGAANVVEPFGDEVFGMIRRGPSQTDLFNQVEEAVRLTDRLRIDAA